VLSSRRWTPCAAAVAVLAAGVLGRGRRRRFSCVQPLQRGAAFADGRVVAVLREVLPLCACACFLLRFCRYLGRGPVSDDVRLGSVGVLCVCEGVLCAREVAKAG